MAMTPRACPISVSSPMAAGQTDRQQTLGATVAILKDIIPQIKASGFNGIIVNISNPADVVTHYLQEKL